MNNGILVQAQSSVPMPYGLLGAPTPIPMPHQAYARTAMVRNGLLLHLDANDPDSYPGYGAQWFDLSGNKFHMSLKNSPTFINNFNAKHFNLNGSNHHGICDGTVQDSIAATVANLRIGGSAPKTVVCVTMVNNGIGSNQGGLFDLGDSGVNGRHYCLRLNSSFTNWRAQFWGTPGPDYDFSLDTRDRWTMFSVVYGEDLIGKTFGNAGTLLGVDDGRFSLVTAGVRPFEMGRYIGSSYYGGRIGLYLIYNKALTPAEIAQNFNAFRAAYQI